MLHLQGPVCQAAAAQKHSRTAVSRAADGAATLIFLDGLSKRPPATSSAIRALPSTILGPVDGPPWKRQRLFPGSTLMVHGDPARVLAQHLGRNLRFNGSPHATGHARTSCDANPVPDRSVRSMRVQLSGSPVK